MSAPRWQAGTKKGLEGPFHELSIWRSYALVYCSCVAPAVHLEEYLHDIGADPDVGAPQVHLQFGLIIPWAFFFQ